MPTGCHVITEEVGKGPAALHLRATNPGALHAGHATWLENLRTVAEK